jgi:ribosomal protein L37E
MTDERTTEEYVYEYWDCPRCGEKGIRGDFKVCASCGFSRDDTINFYRKDVDEVVSDEAQVDKFKQGPDWVCSYCGSLISQTDGKCGGCGMTRDDSVKNYFELKGKEDAGDEVTAGSEAAPPPPPDSGEEKKGKGKLFGIIGGVAAAIAIVAFWGLSSKAVKYKVKSVYWERGIAVDRYKLTNNTDWEDEMKGDEIRVIRKNREIRRYDKRQVGTRTESYKDTEKYQAGTKEECTTSYKSTGSGAAKKTKKCRDVPVYKTREVTKTREVPVYREFPVYGNKVIYVSKMYSVYTTPKKSGRDNSPSWPAVKLGEGLDGKPDKEGERSEKYNVTLSKISKAKGPGEVIFKTRSDLFEKKYILNNEIEMKVSNLGGIKYDKGEEEVKVIRK